MKPKEISKYPKGANLEASAYFNEQIKRMCPRQAKIPIIESHNHCIDVGLTQTIGTKNDDTVAPTIPVNKSVNNGLSVE